MRKLLLTVIMSCLAFFLSVAQPVVKTSVDKDEILIGQQFNLKVQATFAGDDFFIKWINVPDSLPHFELIQKSKIDSTFDNQHLSGLSQTFTFTSFDSGKWTLPTFNIIFNGVKNDSVIKVFTDSLPMIVSFSTADTTQALKDIKAIRQVEAANTIWYWIGGALLLLLLGLLIYWLYKRNKKVKKIETLPSNVGPYEEALQQLENLSAYNLALPKEVLQYHVKLIEIFRRYLSRKENSDYQNKTTGDILIALKDNYRGKDIISKASTAMRFSDAVKFAKYSPPAAETIINKQLIKDSIDSIELPAIINKL